MNNYDRYKVYEIDSNLAELDVDGLIVETHNGTTIVMSEFKYQGSVIENIYSIDYEVYLNDQVISTGGKKADEIKTLSKKNELDIRDVFSALNIYINNSERYNLNDIGNFFIRFNYVDKAGVTYRYELPLKVEKKFSNNRLVYNK